MMGIMVMAIDDQLGSLGQWWKFLTINTMKTNMMSMDGLMSTKSFDTDFDDHLMHLH